MVPNVSHFDILGLSEKIFILKEKDVSTEPDATQESYPWKWKNISHAAKTWWEHLSNLKIQKHKRTNPFLVGEGGSISENKIPKIS